MDITKLHIKSIPGVGIKKAELITKELGISSCEEMLYHIPYKYIDRSKIYKINQITSELPYIQIKAKIKDLKSVGTGKSLRMTAIAYDETGMLELVWFRGYKYLVAQINNNTEYLIFGQPSVFNRKLNMVHPEINVFNSNSTNLVGFQAVYPTTEKMKKGYINSKAISKIMASIFSVINPKYITETLPNEIIKREGLIYRYEALYNIHFPSSIEILEKAKYRLKFEELFYIQLNSLQEKYTRKLYFKGLKFSKIGENVVSFYKDHLPFELTDAQKRVIKEIRHDCGVGIQMNRLLQGDVGSGKTLVAVMSMLIALDNNYQSCLMAPTEILAVQHMETISELLVGMNIKVALLTGSTKKKDRQVIHKGLLTGDIKIIIGTHALLEDIVSFKNLGLAIIDEQHRFGVAQRARLWKKNNIPPHILVMTATPIPRTLAMTLYGDLDISVIDELPPGRKPVTTYHAYENRKTEVFKFIEKELQLGHQAYIVYPMIFDSEKTDYMNLEKGLEEVEKYFSPLNYKIGMVHGKMKAADKDVEMKRFVENDTQILVATTVIEVGVNIPNASVMLIESTERFGLSQLHQLRGRVGRGADQSYCILMSSYKLSNEARTRIETMTSTNDGFEIAEVDMRLRGQGDIEGTQQSGITCNLKVANLAQDTKILHRANALANNILSKDAELNNPNNELLKYHINRLFKKLSWHYIS